jgi:hypothetical protein
MLEMKRDHFKLGYAQGWRECRAKTEASKRDQALRSVLYALMGSAGTLMIIGWVI